MTVTQKVNECIGALNELAIQMGHEYITPEHLLYVLCEKTYFQEAVTSCGADVSVLKEHVKAYLDTYLTSVEDPQPMESFSMQQLFLMASQQVINSGRDVLAIEHLIGAMMEMPESFAVYYLEEQGVYKGDLLFELCHEEEKEEHSSEREEAQESVSTESEQGDYLKHFVTNLNTFVADHKEPLVEREAVLERTMEILCRKTKNNPIHIGEPGVGKTAITLSLAKRINEGKVPKKLEGATLFMMDLGGMLAGTQYRGDFEKRIKKVLESIKTYPNPIVYIDEIHNLVGAGALGNGAMDASNLLKPYLLEGHIRFIGATTFEEYKKHFEKDRGLVRRFQTIEVKEPTVQECLAILKGLQGSYEAYHGVHYTEEALEAAVTLSHHYINERFLPDKAIDLIDEAGAYLSMQETEGVQEVTVQLIEKLLAKICHIPEKTVARDEMTKLKNLEQRLGKQIFGQNHALQEVVKHIKLSRAGLHEGDKPIASMLFVGPTGVGKTEIAKCLATEMGMKLIRFDMSEYGEKHTASKLIGSPPGYVGYEEGGLLTDAIRKTPHAVLLLDEIEKAHSDVFNMLLQVMDYATLTDSHGKKADFRNVILIMTSNAGARSIGKQLVGFGERMVKDDAMQEEIKKIFTPEFRNRLSGTIMFNHLTEEMAYDIAKKEVNKLKEILLTKQIELKCGKACIEAVAKKGMTKEFGARGIKRIVETEIKPLLVEEILFGHLQKGGQCKVVYQKENFVLKIS